MNRHRFHYLQAHGIQDTLARILEDKNNRAIRFGVVNVASMVFLPI